MDEGRRGPLLGYLHRVLLLAVTTSIASGFGSLWTWTTNDWENANPLISGPVVAAFALGAPIGIVSLVRLPPWAVGLVAIALAASIIAMWWAFATNSSSTSGLHFLVGGYIGIPASCAIAWFVERRESQLAMSAAR